MVRGAGADLPDAASVPGMSGSFEPMTASDGTGTLTSRSSDGNRVSSLSRFNVLIGPNFR